MALVIELPLIGYLWRELGADAPDGREKLRMRVVVVPLLLTSLLRLAHAIPVTHSPNG
jgi:hypothetical protein